MPNVSPKPYKTMQAEFAAECARLAQDAHYSYIRNISEPVYLCGTKRAGLDTLNPRAAIWERLSCASERDIESLDYLDYVRPEPLPRNQTLEHLTATVREILSKEPLAIFAD